MALLLVAPARATAGELWIWERDFYVHRDVGEDYVRESLERANWRVQEKHGKGGVACPVELRIRELILFDGSTPGLIDRPGRVQPPSSHLRPGFYFHNGSPPAFAMVQQQLASFWVLRRKKNELVPLKRPAAGSQAWAIAHEWGHLAGLDHIYRQPRAQVDDPSTPEDERATSDDPCTLMSYDYGFPSPPKGGVKCRSGRRLEAWQCEAYKSGADRVEQTSD